MGEPGHKPAFQRGPRAGESALVDRSRVPVKRALRTTRVASSLRRCRARWLRDFAARVDGVDGDAIAVTYDDGSEESIHPG